MNEMYVLDSDENVILSDPRLSFYFDNKRVGAPTQVTYQELVPYVDIVAHYNRGLIQNRDHFSIMCFSEIWFIWRRRRIASGYRNGQELLRPSRRRVDLRMESRCLRVDRIVVPFESFGIARRTQGRCRTRTYHDPEMDIDRSGRIEAWCDYRRTGYPEMPVKSLAGNDGVLPTRLLYPADEEFRNPVNYDEAVNGWLGG